MKRQIWIDVLKGLGIISVVVGHITYNRLLMKTIFMFHMPLFFLIGGWLHNTDAPQRQYLKARVLSLLVPYLSFLLILWPLELLLAYPGQTWTVAWMRTMLIEPMLVGGPLLTGYAAVFWFVTCYFLTQQLMHFLLRRFSIVQCAVICGVMLVGAYLNAAFLHQWWLPWSANAVLIAAPLYFIGYWARSRAAVMEPVRDLMKLMPLFAIGAMAAALLNVFGVNNSLDLKNGDYGLPIVTLASALICVVLLAMVAQRLHTNVAGRVLATIGGASMTIMFLHQFVQLTMAKVFGISQVAPRVVVALAGCFLIHALLKRSPLLARLFLGMQTTRVPSLTSAQPLGRN